MPLYPQYAAATTATVCDKAFDALEDHALAAFAARGAALAGRARLYRGAGQLDRTRALPPSIGSRRSCSPPSTASRRNIPTRAIPITAYCYQTVRLLNERLGWPEGRLKLTFQSRFGKAEWLQPYTDKTVEALAKSGVKRMAVITPGFVADCLETLEEIAGENAEIFHHNGGEKFHFIPCLNDTADGIKVLEAVVRRELSGWAELGLRLPFDRSHVILRCSGAARASKDARRTPSSASSILRGSLLLAPQDDVALRIDPTKQNGRRSRAGRSVSDRD